MTCKNCGAQLLLDQQKCPYCGTQNPEYIKQQQHKITIKSRRIVILCIMTILFLLSILFAANSWNIASAISDWHAAANSEKYCAMLDAYEEQGDYLSFAALYDQKYLYGLEDYQEYQYVYTAASNYSSIYNYITRLLEEEPWEDAHEDALKYLCESLKYHYEAMEREPYEWYYEIGACKEQHLDAVERIDQKIEDLLQFTFSMTEEELTEFRSFSFAEKQVFIERRFHEHE